MWSTRYVVVLAVLFSTLGSITLFIVGSYEIIYTIIFDNPLFWGESGNMNHKKMLYTLIGAIDLYLIAIVLLIFGFGIYELFVSKIDIAHPSFSDTILDVENLDELKDKIIKVIIICLLYTSPSPRDRNVSRMPSSA